MADIPKTESEDEELSEKLNEASAWAEDEKKHVYYYDDAHGYEEYDPKKDSEDKDEEDDLDD